MKTKTHIRNLSRLVTIFSLTVLLGSALVAQPVPESNTGYDQSTVDRLESLMVLTEQAIRYEAPETYLIDQLEVENESREVENALRNLDLLADATALKLQYVAPDEEVDNATIYLEMLADATEKSMQYDAPAATDQESDETDCQLAQTTKRDAGIIARRTNRPVQVEVSNYTLQETWLIKAGYYKSARTPVWAKIRKAFRSKPAVKHYAAQF